MESAAIGRQSKPTSAGLKLSAVLPCPSQNPPFSLAAPLESARGAFVLSTVKPGGVRCRTSQYGIISLMANSLGRAGLAPPRNQNLNQADKLGFVYIYSENRPHQSPPAARSHSGQG